MLTRPAGLQLAAPGDEVDHAADRHRRLLGARVVAVLAGQAVLDQAGEHRAQVSARKARAPAARVATASASALQRRAPASRSPPSPAAARCSCDHAVGVRARRSRGSTRRAICAQHQHVGVVEADHARAGAPAKARRPAHVAHRVVAGVAVEQHQLGEQPVAAALRVEQHVHQLAPRERLADRPDPHAVPLALALLPVGVDARSAPAAICAKVSSSKLMRGWPGAHHAVGDEPVGVAEVARQAQPRLRDGLRSVGYRPACDVLGVAWRRARRGP